MNGALLVRPGPAPTRPRASADLALLDPFHEERAPRAPFMVSPLEDAGGPRP